MKNQSNRIGGLFLLLASILILGVFVGMGFFIASKAGESFVVFPLIFGGAMFLLPLSIGIIMFVKGSKARSVKPGITARERMIHR